jgi:hypothetical protein
MDHLRSKPTDSGAQTSQCPEVFEGGDRTTEIVDLEPGDVIESPCLVIEHITRPPGETRLEGLPVEV